MTNDSPAAAEPDDERRNDRLITLYVGVIALLALGTFALVAKIEFTHGTEGVNWTLFVILATLLLVTETQSRTWIKVGGGGGVVTPSWTFAFALILTGTPFGATVAIAVATLTAELIDRKPAKKVIFNLAQITFSISTGALVLFAFDVHRPVFATASTPLLAGTAVILSGFAVFTVNGLVLCKLLAILDGASLMTMMRNGFAVSMSADGAMIAIAPILVITAQNTLLMLPLIGVATFFVYQTARQAIEQSHQADHDPLTQLLNRRAFNVQIDKFTQLADTSTSGGVFVLDLDKFKEINDRLGHGTGDHVLQAFAQRLERSLPGDTTIARLGGDEFAVLIVDRSAEEVAEIAEALHAEIRQPLIVDDFPISAGSSIGVSFFPQHGESPSELMHAADVAMYRAKQLRSGVEHYEVLGAPQQKGRVSLLGDLAGAIERNEFILTYQPQIHIASGRTTCVEALLRWQHPTIGMIAPGEFVALAEQTDLIGPLTELVIEQALVDAARLPDDVSVSINISARNLQDRHFAANVLAAIQRHQFDPRRVELEITESAVSSDPEQSVTAIEQIRAAGIRIAIDDFGTGYSSFDTLRKISVDNIKIDRSFVTGALSSRRDREILQALIDLGHSLGLTVVAEGVETADVLEFLADAGCDTAQGYLIARPALIEDVVVHSMSLGDQMRQATS